jgi:hypothetical protein
MPTRIELDDELSARLGPMAKARGISLRELVRELLRQALAAPPKQALSRYTLRAHDFGADLENPWAVFAELETQDYLTLLTRK